MKNKICYEKCDKNQLFHWMNSRIGGTVRDFGFWNSDFGFWKSKCVLTYFNQISAVFLKKQPFLHAEIKKKAIAD